MTKLSTILDQIESGTVLLPEFQRGYVWNRDQVRGLMRSLYLGYPIGGLLLWETETDGTAIRGASGAGGTRLLLLDGQQRITSLYGVIRGHAPTFFEGNPATFTGLYFNVADQSFEFYAPSKMAGDPRWVNVTELFRDGPVPYFTALTTKFGDEMDKVALYLERLNTLAQIKDHDFFDEKITGRDKTVDVVVDIFNRVNSGGTQLSKGDLALARICAQWPEARHAMRDHLSRWEKAGFTFTLDWLLRNITAVAKGRSVFSELGDVSASDFQQALTRSADYVDSFLNAVSGRLGVDHDRVLMGRSGIPVIARLLHRTPGGKFTDAEHRDKVLFWHIHAGLWGRFAGSVETVLQQDYETLERSGIDGLIASLERWRGGNLDIQAHDFEASTIGSRFYPLLYLLTRVKGARDLGSGLPLRAETLGKLSSLQVHHIFPKAVLYKAGYDRTQVNAIANFCFLTQDSNLTIGKRPPEDYFAEVEEKHPGVLASQWIPTDPELWRVDRYGDFLAARRELLAQAAQSFLNELRTGKAPLADTPLQPVTVTVEEPDDAIGAQIASLVADLVEQGCAQPALDAEIADPATGRQLAVAEAYWPDGLQPGQGKPVVLELDENPTALARLTELGYEVFTAVDALRGYVARRNENAAGEQPTPQADYQQLNAAESDGAGFDKAMHDIYVRAKKEANYTAGYFLSLLAEHGALATARKLLHAPAVSDGFAALWERGRLDLTVEALVIDPRFAGLFTEAELDMARRRLQQFGYQPSTIIAEPDSLPAHADEPTGLEPPVSDGSQRHNKRPVSEVLADAEKADVAEIFGSLIMVAKEFDLPQEGFLNGIMITPPEDRRQHLVWIALLKRPGRARVAFNHKRLAQRTGMAEENLQLQLPTRNYDAADSTKAAATLREVLTKFR
ncbi:DUF262 domain-containing protein [Amycolatopsis rhizosphaerae]|uniref:DUF262 domain-containing protein n=1 Tax=Amycolatopsis rhizosphaerae TaxID=2053003 RepID=A0A558D5Q5_9PSEU|nr:DUF262 domain-containing protein [Amycolatopsis rhizosphaerae]TVT56346.1 DUF262 domain-containing protein [Amycolatopsis rhizosphaerae]